MRPMSLNSASYPFSAIYEENLEARARIELANKGFADLCLTTWLPRPVPTNPARLGELWEQPPRMANPRAQARVLESLERETGFEPATSTLARSHSTTELLPLDFLILQHFQQARQASLRLHFISAARAEWDARCWGESLYPDFWKREDLPDCATLVKGAGPLRVQLRRNHLTVAEVQDAIAVAGRLGVVGNHQHGLAQFPIGALQHIQYHVGILRIQISCWLVGEHDRRFIDEGACQGDPLLFAAAQFAGAVIQALVDAEQLGDVAEVLVIVVGALPGNVEGNLDIVAGGEGWQQVELLEDEADFTPPQMCPLGVRGVGEVSAVDQHPAGIGLGKSAENIEEGGLAAARRAYNAEKLSLFHLKGDAAHRRNVHFADAIGLADILDLNNCCHRCVRPSYTSGRGRTWQGG